MRISDGSSDVCSSDLAVHSKMERTGLRARDATVESMKEISGAIVSITLVMAAVFVPVMFMQGPVGVFYKQFAFTLSIAILISAFNALTLRDRKSTRLNSSH